MTDVVYRGLWKLYDRGPVAGVMLSLNDATLLIAFLAILLTHTAARSWKIWRLLLHTILGRLMKKARL